MVPVKGKNDSANSQTKFEIRKEENSRAELIPIKFLKPFIVKIL